MAPVRESQPPLLASCDTMVASAAAAARGVAIFGKNSDRPPGEAQAPLLLERAQHPAGATVRCQYITIPQVRETARVLGSRPTWLWGFEMGLNEHGVAIGNETIFAHEAPAASGLIGMDLVRLGLERGRSAEQATDVLIALIETHGQGGSGYRDIDWPYNNSFLVADPERAFILEAVGRHWAARRCDDVDAISNQVSIGADWDRLSGTAVEQARAAGRETCEPFDFARAYRDCDTVPRALSEGRLRRSRQMLRAGRGRHTPATVRDVLRDHDSTGPRFVAGATPDQEQFYTLCMHQGHSRTAMSMVAELEVEPRAPRLAWLAFGRPCASVYFPLLLAGRLPERLARAGEEGPAGDEGLWWVFERLAAQAEASPESADTIATRFAGLERDLAADVTPLRRELASLPPSEQGARAAASADDVAARIEHAAHDLLARCERGRLG